MILTTLVLGPTALHRENAIAPLITSPSQTAAILEGLPSGNSSLDEEFASAGLRIARIAPGCLCCTGNLTMQVTLNRVIRQQPGRLFIGIATSDHLAGIRNFLLQPPYNALLQLTEDLLA